MAYNVYSITDCKVELGHPDVGRAHIHQCGHGKITISSAGDLTSHTMTVDGYVVVNKLTSTNGTITIEIPQNGQLDEFFVHWIGWQKKCDPSRIALGVLTIEDLAGGFTVTCTGVTIQKMPDRVFDRTATNRIITLLATTITEQ